MSSEKYFERISPVCGQLNRVVEKLYPELSYNFLMKLIRKKEVSVNGKKSSEGSEVKKGDAISIYLKPFAVPIDYKYKDDNFVVVYKPKGVASDGEHSFSSLVDYALNGAILLHRLDTNTDGLLMFARNPKSEKLFLEGMKAGEIDKYYKATVYGDVLSSKGTFTDYLVKDSSKGRVKIYNHPINGSDRVTLDYRVLSIKDGLTELEVLIHGGKTHQIRAQLAFHGMFIIGDGKYGDDRINKLYKKKSQELTAYKLHIHLKEEVYSNLVVML